MSEHWNPSAEKLAIGHAAQMALWDRIKRADGVPQPDAVIHDGLIVWARTMYGVLDLEGSPDISDALRLLDVLADLELALKQWMA